LEKRGGRFYPDAEATTKKTFKLSEKVALQAREMGMIKELLIKSIPRETLKSKIQLARRI